jgi:phosphoenolpyruvate phosphomutase
VLDEAGLMAMITRIPMVLDDNTKNGELDHVRCLARKLCRLEIAGSALRVRPICDAKQTVREKQSIVRVRSLWKNQGNEGRPDRQQFLRCGRAGNLAGSASISDVLFSSEAYCEAGADAIFLLSNTNETAVIFAFAKERANRAPLVVMSVTGYQPPIAKFAGPGVAAVIWLPKWGLTHSRFRVA